MTKKHIVIIILLVVLSCVIGFAIKTNETKTPIVSLGLRNSDTVWVYLCGLTNDFYAPREVKIRKSLNDMANKLGISILAISPFTRCPQFNDALCWPHNSNQETLQTYKKLRHSLNDIKIAGFIGFSNAGFFLNKLAQLTELNQPIISIGAPGYFIDSKIKNRLFLVIGKKDQHHYKDALQFYTDSKKSPLYITLIEHEKGHAIPIDLLENIIQNFL